MKNTNKIDKLPKDAIRNSRVIAKGKRLRKLRHLLNKYGGVPSKWTKKSSMQFEVDGDSYEYHWYEHHGIGRFEFELKKIKK